MSYLSYYLEEGSENVPMYSHCDLSENVKSDIKASFLESGGQWIQTEVKPGLRFIISKWSTSDGYDLWLNNDKSKEYLTLRDNYNSKNNIKSKLIAILPEKL